MATTTRRPHKKSRHGCQQCKKNRTKCDETKPSCSRCQRTGAKCSLLDPSSALIIISDASTKSRQASERQNPVSPPISAPSPTTKSSTGTERSPANAQYDFSTPTVPTSAPKPPESTWGPWKGKSLDPKDDILIGDLELTRLRLMHHYSQHTSHSIIDLTLGTKEGQSIWDVSVPELAFRYDFLLHGLLSTSALHMALSDPTTQHYNGILAVQHHSRAITLYTPHLSAITADNIDALFAFACLTALYTFGIHLRGHLQLSPLVKIHEVFTMLRGTSILVESGLQWLEQGIWGPWFRDPDEDHVPTLSDEIEEILKRLTNRINSTITTSAQGKMYYDSIQALRKNYHQARRRPRTQMALVMLPVLTPPEFLQMVCIGEPLALSILANWGVILHWMRGHIWLRNWGAQTVRAVHEVLPPDWHDCIEWALGEIDESLNAM